MEMAGAVVTVMVVLTTATVMTMVTVIVEEAMEALTVSMARIEEVMIVSSGSGDVGGGNACKGDSVDVDEDNMSEVIGDGGLEVLTAATVDEGGNGEGNDDDSGDSKSGGAMAAEATLRRLEEMAIEAMAKVAVATKLLVVVHMTRTGLNKATVAAEAMKTIAVRTVLKVPVRVAMVMVA